MNVQDKEKIPDKIPLAKLLQAAGAQQEDSFESLLKKVLDTKYLYSVPSWAETWYIPADTIASAKSAAACWLKLGVLRKDMKVAEHPAYVIENLIQTTEVIVTGENLTYMEVESKKPITIGNSRGYFVTETTNSASVVAASHVADVLTYYTRSDGKGSVDQTIPPEIGAKAGMIMVDCTSLRFMLAPNIASQTKARDAIYAYCSRNVGQAYALCNSLCMMTPNYAARSDAAYKAYMKMAELDTDLVDIQGVLLPSPNKQQLISIDDMDEFYQYLNICHRVRGQDKGAGMITNNYLRGFGTRSQAKVETNFLDIRQLASLYEVDVIVVIGTVTEYLKRMCVRNGIFIIDQRAVNEVMLSEEIYNHRDKDGKRLSCGVFSSLDSQIPYGIVYFINSVPPKIKEGKVFYQSLNLTSLLSISEVKTAQRFSALKVHFHPDMIKKNKEKPEDEDLFYDKVSLRPPALPHNGMVWVCYPRKSVIPCKKLISRASRANCMRNNYVITKRSWILLDDMKAECGYSRPYVIPKMIIKATKTIKSFVEYYEEVKEDAEKIEELVAKIVVPPQFNAPPLPPSVEMLAGEVAKCLVATGNTQDSYVSAFKCWNDVSCLPVIAALRVAVPDRDDAHRELCALKIHPKHIEAFEKGKVTLDTLLMAQLKKDKDEKKKQEENKKSAKPASLPNSFDGFANQDLDAPPNFDDCDE